MNLRNLLIRSVSGICYVGAIVGSLYWGIIPFYCLTVIIGVLAMIEFHKLCVDRNFNPNTIPSLIIDILTIVCIIFSWYYYPLLMWIFLFICRLIMELYLKNTDPIKCFSISFMGQLYIGIPLGCLTLLASLISLHFVFAIFLMIWINDTGAYLVGCTLGKHRLFERISPKKSWEGFFGGLAFNILAGWLFCIGGKDYWGLPLNVITWMLIGLTVTLFSTWGDLIESLIKRSLNVKDSGSLIPGHGGILDRIDSLLLVFPAILIFIAVYIAIFPQMQSYLFLH